MTFNFEIDNAAETDKAQVYNGMAAQLRQIRAILDDETINNVKVILEAIEVGRENTKDKELFEKGTMSIQIPQMEILLSKLAAVRQIAG